jgi:hypothetical protein
VGQRIDDDLASLSGEEGAHARVPDPDLVMRDVGLEALACLERLIEDAASHADVRLSIILRNDKRRQRLV